MKILFLILFTLLLSSCTTVVKNKVPASITELTLASNNSRMPGHIYQAAGSGPHPTAVMLHGYPGNEKNLDVAQALRRTGWNAVFFHYRGAWGSEGEFSFLNAEQDVDVVINYLQQSDTAKELGVDPNKISLVGHSMGGHMAVAGLLNNASVVCAIAHDGANLGARGKGLFSNENSTKLWREYSDTLFMLNGWSGEKALKEISDNGTELDLEQRANRLNKRAVKLIAADTEVIPVEVHIKPLFAALSQYSDKVSYELIDDDHSFSNSRLRLIGSTIGFLSKHCK